jgi:hypothetical protein
LKLSCLFVIYIGHGGARVAEYVKEHLISNLISHPNFISDTKKAIGDLEFFLFNYLFFFFFFHLIIIIFNKPVSIPPFSIINKEQLVQHLILNHHILPNSQLKSNVKPALYGK